jgi:WD40 repeat protein
MVLCFLLATADYSLAQGRAGHALRLDINGHSGGVTSVAISSDDILVASGGMDGRIRIWDIADGRELYVFGENREVADVVFSPDDKQVLCAVRDDDNKYVLQIWDYRKQKLRKTIEGYGQRINSVAYSPDGKLIVSGSGDGTVWIRHGGNGRSVRKYETANNGVLGVNWSPDGSHIVEG